MKSIIKENTNRPVRANAEGAPIKVERVLNVSDILLNNSGEKI